MAKRYMVAIKPNPITQEDKQFNLDALTLLNMLNGKSYEEAHRQALLDVKGL